MFNADFDQLKKNQGDLLSVNGFLTTSFYRAISTMFAESAGTQPETTDIFFE